MYRIKYASQRVKKQLDNFPKADREFIIRKIDEKLAHYGILTRGIKRLQNDGRLRLRAGDYRVLFTREKKVITIHSIRPRKDAY